MAQKTSTGRWTNEEHDKFIEGIKLYGKNWKKIEQLVGSRTGAQVRSHAQKFFTKMQPNPKRTPNTDFEKFSPINESNWNSPSNGENIPDYLDPQFSYYVKCMYTTLLKSKNSEELVYKLLDCKNINKDNGNPRINQWKTQQSLYKIGFQPYQNENNPSNIFITQKNDTIL